MKLINHCCSCLSVYRKKKVVSSCCSQNQLIPEHQPRFDSEQYPTTSVSTCNCYSFENINVSCIINVLTYPS